MNLPKRILHHNIYFYLKEIEVCVLLRLTVALKTLSKSMSSSFQILMT